MNPKDLQPGNGGVPPAEEGMTNKVAPKKNLTRPPSPTPPPSSQSPSPHPDAPAPAPSCSSPAAAPDRAKALPDHSTKNSPSPHRCSALATPPPLPPQTPRHFSTGGYRQPLAEAPAPPPSPRPQAPLPCSPRFGTESGPPPQIAAAYHP